MKMTHKNPSIEPRVIEILEGLLDFWDEDIQQRAVEYLGFLKQAKTDPSVKDLMLVAMEPMPTFSDSLQANNILLRRIMRLKVNHTLNINPSEAD